MSTEDHRIFSKNTVLNIPNKNVVQHVKYNRTQLLSKQTAEELNTYLNFGVFPTFSDTYPTNYDKNGKLIDDPELKKTFVGGSGTPGVRSIFNRAGVVMLGSSDGRYDIDITQGDETNVHYWRISNNVPLMDSPKARQRIRKTSGCSIKELVTASQNGLLGQETYSYSDFMYCKHLGKMSNNYMITLRRFALPVDDYIGTTGEDADTRLRRASKNAACIGCMVTWMGVSGNNLSDLLSYSYKMPFKIEEFEEQDRNQGPNADENATLLNSMFSLFDSKYKEQYQAGYNSEAIENAFDHLGVKKYLDSFGTSNGAAYKNIAGFRDTKTKVYGPIDSIRSTYVRDDKGLEFEHKLSLVFEYELKSYNGINGKQAMLDLISNILNVTYTTGSFWGGGFKGYAAHQSNIFANLEIFKARGGFTNFLEAFANDVTSVWDTVKTSVEKQGGLIETIKNFGQSLGGMMLSGILNRLGRPQKAMYNALLSPAPIGFWHVTIGNPKRPIMSIGNMIITNVKIEHNGPLGIDDFPTGLKVTVELDRGKPRDLRDIEKLYMQGTDRIYSSMSDKVFDMYKNSELYKSHKNSGSLGDYKPVTNIATFKEPVDGKSKPTITIENYANMEKAMMKYFGTNDAYSIYIPAAEQEYGAGKKKPSTAANENLVGENAK